MKTIIYNLTWKQAFIELNDYAIHSISKEIFSYYLSTHKLTQTWQGANTISFTIEKI